MRQAPNPFIGVNYIPDNLRMEAPPTYWLQRLYDFDRDLVVFPSRQQPFAYVLARKCRKSGGVRPDCIVSPQSDTAMVAKYKCVPVCLILRHSTASWSIDNILADLRSRDTWAYTDGEASKADRAANAVEAAEAKAEAKRKADTRDMFYHMSGDAYRSYKARTGQRTRVATIANGGKSARTPGSTAGLGRP